MPLFDIVKWIRWPAVAKLLDQRSLRNLFVEILANARQRAGIDHGQLAAGELEHVHTAEFRQRLVGMDQRQSESVGDVLLGERKVECVVGDEPEQFRALVEHDDQGGDTLGGAAASGAGK